MAKPTGNPPGAPDPGANRTTHGIVALRNQIKRRRLKGRSVIDRRSTAGRNAIRVQQQLIQDQGGVEQLSAGKLILIELIARDVYYLDEVDRRISNLVNRVNKETGTAKKYGVKGWSILYGYRSPAARNLAANLLALGLEKVEPKPKSLEEILNEESDDEQEEP